MTKVSLVIVDLQEDFLPPNGSLAIKDGRSIIPAINELLYDAKFNWSLILVTQDWHPPNHASFASQHNVPPFTELTFTHPKEVKTMKQVVWPDHCIQNTPGATLDPSFKECVGDRRESPIIPIKKGHLPDREYYSCFQDCWGLDHTEVLSLLKTNNITDVVFVGLAYDFCVMNSAIDCAKNGFNTYVLKEYSKSVYPENVEETDKKYAENGVKVVNANEEEKLFTDIVAIS
ncbi:PNC1 Nicotinamidase [Candida maltosa Xu316]